MSKLDYVIRVLASPLEVNALHWNDLLATQADATPFMRHEYLAALHQSAANAPTIDRGLLQGYRNRQQKSSQIFFARGVGGRGRPTQTSTAVSAEICSDPRGAAAM